MLKLMNLAVAIGPLAAELGPEIVGTANLTLKLHLL